MNVIVEGLSSSKAELMGISEDKTKIRRSPNKSLPEVTDEHKNYVKKIPVYILKASLLNGWKIKVKYKKSDNNNIAQSI